MSVLIKSMEMPESKETFLRLVQIDGNGNVKVYGNPTESYEAVSIPPHGRLIDEDDLIEKAYGRAEKCGDMVNELDKVISVYDIRTAQTIIESEDK